MRIISGKFKGRRFKAPNKIPARPTTDYAKEGLFNMLQNEVNFPEIMLLDLFSGIGNISIEAVSRGIQSVTCVDQNYAAIQWVKHLIIELEIENIDAYKAESIRWLEKNEQRFGLVFADPPYAFEHYEKLIELVLERALADDGMFILEHRKSMSFEEHPNFAAERTYGEVRFSWFK